MQPQGTPAAPTLDAYQLRLPVFAGPLDVLLRLIEREQLPISEISLLAVLDQFLDFVRRLDPAPAEVIAEFVVVAGRLSLLKSRSLLPRPAKPLEDMEIPDLVRQLEEYRAVRGAAVVLAVRHQSGLGAYGRGVGIATPPGETIPLPPQPPSALARAVKRWLTRAPLHPVVLPARAAITLREMIARVVDLVTSHQQAPFDRIRATCLNRQDVAVAFLALLTLVRRRHIDAVQTNLFGPITLIRIEIAVTSIANGSMPETGDHIAESGSDNVRG